MIHVPTGVVAKLRSTSVVARLAAHLWENTPESGKRSFRTVSHIRRAPLSARRYIAQRAELEAMPTDEEWEAASHIVARKVRERREMAGS